MQASILKNKKEQIHTKPVLFINVQLIEFIHILLQFKEKSKSKISIIDTKNRKIHCVLRKNSKFIHKHVDIELFVKLVKHM